MKNDLRLISAAFENLLCTQEKILCRNEDQYGRKEDSRRTGNSD